MLALASKKTIDPRPVRAADKPVETRCAKPLPDLLGGINSVPAAVPAPPGAEPAGSAFFATLSAASPTVYICIFEN